MRLSLPLVRKNPLSVFLSVIERVGNALPHPGTLFALLAAAIVLVSGIASWAGLEVIHPGTGETIRVVNKL